MVSLDWTLLFKPVTHSPLGLRPRTRSRVITTQISEALQWQKEVAMQLKGLTKHMLGASNRKARILVAREMRTRIKRNDYSWRRVRRVVIVAFEKHSKCNYVDVQCLINQGNRYPYTPLAYMYTPFAYTYTPSGKPAISIAHHSVTHQI